MTKKIDFIALHIFRKYFVKYIQGLIRAAMKIIMTMIGFQKVILS
jgi:hypothetical protein